ncbi:MAG: protein kinase [Sandaracinaceae bacterium]|nr:protein kinase [Sandaracinaceae bacterium]
MAALYLGRRQGPAGFAKPVAIKVVHEHLVGDASFVEMFLDEARLAARISDPNVVQVEALGEADGVFYLAMEYVLGTSLANLLDRIHRARRGLSPEVACAIAMRVAAGLHAAHELKDERGASLEVVHRDVSPQNVLVSRAGHVKLIDFGVAKSRGSMQQTEAGSLKGKLRYMPPEQAWGKPIDRRADVYALGVVLWEMLTLRPLFRGDTEIETLELVRNPSVVPPSHITTRVSEALDAVVLTALAPELEDRYPTANALRRALAEACPEALRVDPEDLAALVDSFVGEELRAEQELLRTFEDATLAPPLEAEHVATVVGRLTRESVTGAGPDQGGTAPSGDVTRAAAPTSLERSRSGAAALPTSDPIAPDEIAPPIAPDTVGPDTIANEPVAAPAAEVRRQRSGWMVAAAGIGLALGVGAGFFAMGSDPDPPSVAAVPEQASVPDAPSCSIAARIEGAEGAPRSLPLDTRGSASPFELPGARNEEVAPAPQILIEYTVPGTGPKALDLSTVNAGTDTLFDTLIAVFRGPCSEAIFAAAPDVALDDQGREFRARGSVAVEGGDVLTLVVTGFGGGNSNRVDRGLVQLDATLRSSTPPTASEATVLAARGALLVTVQAGDEDGDAEAIEVRLLDAAGAPLDVRARDDEDDDEAAWGVRGDFQRSVAGSRTFEERSTVRLRSEDAPRLEAAASAEVRVVDAIGGTSAPIRVPVVRGRIVGPEEACDATRACPAELTCGARGTCAPDVDRSAICRDPAPLELTAGADGRIGASVQGIVDPGPGYFRAQCLEQWTAGREDVYRVTIPAGAWDLVLTTDSEGTAGGSRRSPDTVLYARRTCLDPRPTSAPDDWCNDDITPGDGPDANQRSRLELRDVAAGDLYVFVELWGSARPDGEGERYELDARLRPVRGAGAPCDPAGVTDRCAQGACDPTAARCSGR